MNRIINKSLLNGQKYMRELDLKQWEITYSVFGPFTKHCGKIQKFRETGHLKHLCRNELGKACLTHDSIHSDSKDQRRELFQIRF